MVKTILCKHWAECAEDAKHLVSEVLSLVENTFSDTVTLFYTGDASLLSRIETTAKKNFGASAVKLLSFADANLVATEKTIYIIQ